MNGRNSEQSNYSPKSRSSSIREHSVDLRSIPESPTGSYVVEKDGTSFGSSGYTWKAKPHWCTRYPSRPHWTSPQFSEKCPVISVPAFTQYAPIKPLPPPHHNFHRPQLVLAPLVPNSWHRFLYRLLPRPCYFHMRKFWR